MVLLHRYNMLMFLVILLVILEPIVLGIGTWFLFKKYYKPLTTSVKIKKNELEKKMKLDLH